MCQGTFDTSDEVVKRAIEHHSDEKIEFIKCILDTKSGIVEKTRFKYDIKPSTAEGQITCGETESLYVSQDQNIHEAECQPVPKDQPKNESTANCITSSLSFDEMSTDFIRKTPDVLKILETHGLLKVFCSFWELVLTQKFPMKNIALLLFVDVIN